MLRVCEIFKSIQGEGRFQGAIFTFLRLTGCNLRCVWCDTKYAYTQGDWMEIGEILERINSYNCPRVEITGGEPLLQEEVYPLMEELLKQDYSLLLETNGSRDISRVPEGVVISLDVKCPDSGMSQHMLWDNLDKIGKHDQVKFVIMTRRDYEFAKDVIREYNLVDKCHVFITPAHPYLEGKILAEWMLEDNLDVRLYLQLHKILWGEERGR